FPHFMFITNPAPKAPTPPQMRRGVRQLTDGVVLTQPDDLPTGLWTTNFPSPSLFLTPFCFNNIVEKTYKSFVFMNIMARQKGDIFSTCIFNNFSALIPKIAPLFF